MLQPGLVLQQILHRNKMIRNAVSLWRLIIILLDEPFQPRLVSYWEDQYSLVFVQPEYLSSVSMINILYLSTSSTSLWWGRSLHSSTSGLCDRASSLVWATFRGFPLFLIACFRDSICFSCSYHVLFITYIHIILCHILLPMNIWCIIYLIINLLHCLRHVWLQFVVGVVSLCDPLLESHVGVVPVAPHLVGALSDQVVHVSS